MKHWIREGFFILQRQQVELSTYMYFIICRQYRSMCLWEMESIQLLSLIQSDSISPGTRLYREVPKGRTYKLTSLLDRTEHYTHIRYYWWILNEWKQYLNLIGTALQTSWITQCLCLNSKIAKNYHLCYDYVVEIWAHLQANEG